LPPPAACGTHANLRFLRERTEFGPGVDEATQLLLCDAQTSGGLLIAVAPERAPALLAALRARGTPAAALIGALEAGAAGTLVVEAGELPGGAPGGSGAAAP
jgi:selenide,water dikinase